MVDYAVVGPAAVDLRSGDAASLREAAAGDGFVWAALDSPDTEALGAVLTALGMGAFANGHGVARHRRAHLDVVDDVSMLVVKTVWYIEDTRQVETGDLTLYTDGRSLVTVRRGAADPVSAARERLADDPELRAGGVAAAVWALLNRMVEDYDGAVEELADDVADLEAEVFSGRRRDRNEDIYFLIRETLEFQSAVRPLVPLAHMIKEKRTGVPALGGRRTRDVAAHLIRVDEAVETCMSLLTTVLTAHQGQIGTWQNEDMKKISAWAAMGLVPTAIAGIYGMNFRYMPELHWKIGYPLIIAFMAVVCLLLYRGFKRNGWL